MPSLPRRVACLRFPVPSRVAGEPGGRDDVRRRQLLAALGAAAASAAGSRADAAVPVVAPRGAHAGELLAGQVRDAMLGLASAPARVSAGAVRAGLDNALADFRDSRYRRLSVTLPRLISAGHVLAADGGGRPGPRARLGRRGSPGRR